MKRYKMLYESLRGEYWIDDGGNVIYADGDIGDVNHEAVVIETMLSSLADDLGLDMGFSDYGVDFDSLIEKAREELDLTPEEQEDWDENGNYEDILTSRLSPENQKRATDIWATLHNRMDAREYGKKYLGWIRVKGNQVDLWQIDASILRTLKEGLEEIIYQDAGSEYDEDAGEAHTFDIESSYPRPQYFRDVPLDEIGDPAALMRYKS